MSQVLINEYLKQLDVLKKVSGTNRESVVREAFKDLLDLLMRVTTVSVETVAILEAMKSASR